MACTATPSATARAAAIPAESPSVIQTGSIRMLVIATWLAEQQTGTSRFSHSRRRGVIAR